MLDDPSEVDSGLQPKRTTRAGGVEQSIRHLAQEELEAYMEGRLAPARLQHCQTHLDSCAACRAELEDLRTFKSDLSGFSRPESPRRELERRKKRRNVTLPLAAAVAIIGVAGISVVLWWGHARLASKTPVAVTVTHSPAPPSPMTASTQTRTPTTLPASPPHTRLADEIAALPVDVRPAVAAAIQHGKLQLPTQVMGARAPAPALLGTAEGSSGFALLAPVGEAIAETRPEFSWQPLAGAIRYSVTIVDVRLHPVQHSPALRTTHWRPRRPLRPGQTYLWQVTARLGHSSAVASESPQGALLSIVPRKLATELAHFRQEHEQAHLVLGALYAQVGMLTESAAELSKVSPGDSSYNTARTLLESLPAASR